MLADRQTNRQIDRQAERQRARQQNHLTIQFVVCLRVCSRMVSFESNSLNVQCRRQETGIETRLENRDLRLEIR